MTTEECEKRLYKECMPYRVALAKAQGILETVYLLCDSEDIDTDELGIFIMGMAALNDVKVSAVIETLIKEKS